MRTTTALDDAPTQHTFHGVHRRPIPSQTEISDHHRLIVLIALGVGTFGIGVSEFVAMGLLNTIATSFSVTENVAGTVISAYALGVVVGAPVIAVTTGKIPRRRLMLLLMAAFALGNGLTAVAPTFPVLVAARFLAGVPHGAFFSVSALVVTSMAAPGQRGRALAFVGMGFPISSLVGVPAAQALGQATGWHNAYVFVALIGVVTLVALWFLMPHMTEMAPTSALAELGSLTRIQVWLALAMGAVGFGGMFAVYTYISWTMTREAGVPAHWMWLVLSIYGVGMIAGNWIGGRLADWSVPGGIFIALCSIAVTLTAFYFLSSHSYAAVASFALIGASASALIPSLQIRLMDVAGSAKTLAGALNHSALNIANATGAAMGGAVIAAGYGYSSPALVGAGLAVAAVAIWAVAMVIERSSVR